MPKPIVAAQMYTVRDFCKNPKQIADSCRRVAKIGYTAIQTSGMGREEPMSATELRRVCDDEGLTICATHIAYTDMRDALDKVVEEHQAMGCRIAGIGGAPATARGSEATWVAFAKEASHVAERLAAAGLDFVYHNHSHEFARFGARTVMEILDQESNPEFFKFEPDTYWVQHGGGNPVTWVRRFRGRCPIVHLKDFAITPDQKAFYTEVGRGNLEWSAILKACEETGVTWMAVEQDTCPGDPFESLRISYENLAAWGYR